LDHIPGLKEFKSIKDDLDLLTEGYAKPTLELYQSIMDDIANFREPRFQTQGEEYEQKIKTTIRKSAKKGLQDAWERDLEVATTEEKSSVVPIERKVTHPDAFRWLQRSED
jgi:hypothetical protein